MRSIKLFTILKTFSPEEIKRFEKFISSPYHNTGRNLKPLFKAVTKYHPEYPINKLTDEKILKTLKLSSKSSIKKNSQQLRVRFSELTKQANSFAVVESILHDSFNYSKTLAGFYFDRNLFNLCRSEIYDCKRIMDETGLDETYAMERMTQQRLIGLSYHKENKKNKAVKEIQHIPLYALSNFIMNIKVQLYSNHMEYPVNYQLLKEITDSLDIDKLAKLCTDDNSGLINKMIFDHKRSKFYLYENTDVFWELIEYYKKNFQYLSDMLKWQYFLGLNKSGTKLMQTQDYFKFGTQMNLLIDFVFSKGIYSFSKNEPLEDVLFTSIIMIKFATESRGKIGNFIDNFLPKVKTELRDRAFNFAQAFLKFKTGNFTGSLECINLITSPTLNEKNNLYKLKIAVFYELNYTEELYYLLDTYNHFITNNNSFKNSNGHYRFSEIIKILLMNKINKTSISKLEKQKIFNSIKTSDFEWWLKQKTEEL